MNPEKTIFVKLTVIKDKLFKEKPTLHLDNFINNIFKLIEIKNNDKNVTYWFNSATDEWDKELYYQFIYAFIIVIYGSNVGEEDITTKKMISSSLSKDAIPEGMILFHKLHEDKHLQYFLNQFINSPFFKSNQIKDNLLKQIMSLHGYYENKEICDILKEYKQSEYFLIIRDMFISTRLQYYNEDVTLKEKFHYQYKTYPFLIKGMMVHYDNERIRGEILLKEKQNK